MWIKFIWRIPIVTVIGFWITTLNVWALPQVMEKAGVNSPSLVSFVWALAILLIDFYLIGWAIGLFDVNNVKGGTQKNAKENRTR